jgi:YidC/Oxa1 family membrane protein insertase
MMTPSTTSAGASSTDKEAQLTNALNKQMLYIFPALTIWIGLTFPIGLTLYWVISTVFSIIQQAIILKHHETNKPTDGGDKKVIEIQKTN